MKNISLIVWLTQLGVSVVVPLGGFVWISVWLQQRFDWGVWVIILGVVLGVIGAADGLRTSLKTMERLSKEKEEEKLPASFNDHD